MKKYLLLVSGVIFVLAAASGFILWKVRENKLISPVKQEKITVIEKPLDKYSFENLKKRNFSGSTISFDKKLKDEPAFTSYLFFFDSDGQKVSGLANIPKKSGKFPVIVMFRGFVDQKIFTSGEGTRRSAEAFAKSGFITLAPDFLGYGESSSPSASSMEERFQTYTTALNLLASIPTLHLALQSINSEDTQADADKIGLWGHSNGGQITLSVLEINARAYPTVLWAPVSKPFPYSILYYTDEFEDRGFILRQVLADFEKDYDAEKYNPTNYFDWIEAPMQLHQGGEDESVPEKWSEDLYVTLMKKDKKISYFSYPGENHNFTSGSWETAIARSVSFYRGQFLR